MKEIRERENFRDAFGADSRYSSIQNKEVLENLGAEGEITYSVYGASESGLGRTINGDNIYLDGIYMKSFRFTSYSKGIQTNGNSALFAAAGYPAQDQWAKDVLENLDSRRLTVDSGGGGKQTRRVLDAFARGLDILAGERKCFAALYVTRKGAVACSAGGAGVFQFTGGELRDITGQSRESINEVSVGWVPVIDREDTYVICSAGLLQTVSRESICDALKHGETCAQAVKPVIDRAKSLTGNGDVSMIVVRALRRRAVSLRRILVPVAIGLAALLLAAAGGGAYYWSTTHPEEKPRIAGETLDGALSEEELEAKCGETIASIQSHLDSVAEKLAEYEGLRDRNTYAGMTRSTRYAPKAEAFLTKLEEVLAEYTRCQEKLEVIRQMGIYDQRSELEAWKHTADMEALNRLLTELETVRQEADTALAEYTRAIIPSATPKPTQAPHQVPDTPDSDGGDGGNTGVGGDTRGSSGASIAE